MAIAIDEDNYPVVLVHFENVATLEDTEKYLSHFQAWLSKQHRFGIILHQSHTEDGNTDEVAKAHRLTVQWAKQNKQQLTEYCAGIALIVEGVEDLAERKTMVPQIIKTVFSCAGQAFGNPAAAELWIQQQIAQTSL
jgi:queuine/archaeosine tRNA-ribosyltransferase